MMMNLNQKNNSEYGLPFSHLQGSIELFFWLSMRTQGAIIIFNSNYVCLNVVCEIIENAFPCSLLQHAAHFAKLSEVSQLAIKTIYSNTFNLQIVF